MYSPVKPPSIQQKHRMSRAGGYPIQATARSAGICCDWGNPLLQRR